MEQPDPLTSHLAISELACVPGTENNPGGLPWRWPLGLDVQVVDFLSSYTVRGVLEGFTPGEVMILLSEPVVEQRMVTVQLNAFVFEGETLYCRPRQDRFEVHISIDDVQSSGLRRAPRFPEFASRYCIRTVMVSPPRCSNLIRARSSRSRGIRCSSSRSTSAVTRPSTSPRNSSAS